MEHVNSILTHPMEAMVLRETYRRSLSVQILVLIQLILKEISHSLKY